MSKTRSQGKFQLSIVSLTKATFEVMPSNDGAELDILVIMSSKLRARELFDVTSIQKIAWNLPAALLALQNSMVSWDFPCPPIPRSTTTGQGEL